MATTTELLADAEAAYHRLQTGTSVREFVDQNGEKVAYTVAKSGDLLAYIKTLGGPTWLPSGTVTGPMRIFI